MRKILFVTTIAVVASIMLAACGPATTPTPTEAPTVAAPATSAPTEAPATAAPTGAPTEAPTAAPTGAPTAAVSVDPSALAQKGKLLVCSDLPYPPFESYDESGNPVGLDIDMAAEI